MVLWYVWESFYNYFFRKQQNILDILNIINKKGYIRNTNIKEIINQRQADIRNLRRYLLNDVKENNQGMEFTDFSQKLLALAIDEC